MDDRPRLSVVVPVHNGAQVLDRCLESIGRSVFRDYECIIVDDASTDDSRVIAERQGVRLVALDRKGGPARARNRGAEHARGRLLVFIDADVCVHPDTLGRVDAHFRANPSADAVFGSYDDVPADPGFVSQYKNLFHHFVHQRSGSEAWTFWAGCGAIRREVFLETGGFDESYRRPCIEDIELGSRLRLRGCRIDLNPEIQATHLKRWTLWGLMRTDVLDRGIPWFLLMLRNQSMPSDLNVRRSDRISIGLVYLMLVLGGIVLLRTGVSSYVALALPALITALLLINCDVYRFFMRKRGFWFTAGVVPLHLLYYVYCGVAAIAGFLIHLWSGLAVVVQQARRVRAAR